MILIDGILLVALFLFGLRGYYKGLFREMLSLGGLITGLAVAVRYDEAVAAFGARYWEATPFILKIVAFVAIFFTVYFLFSLAGWLLHRSENVLFLRSVNRMGGIALGFGRGVAVAALLIFFTVSASWIPQSARKRLEGSYLVPPLAQLADEMVRFGKERLFPKEGGQART